MSMIRVKKTRKKPISQGRDASMPNNDEIEKRIAAKPSFVKLWAALELDMINGIEKSAELKENILDNLGMIAVIGALFGASNLASFMMGVEEVGHAGVGQFIGCVRFTAAGAGLTTAFYAAVIMSMTNAIPKDRFRPWVLDFVSVFPLPTYCLLASIGLFSVDMTMSSYFLYGAGLTVYIAVSFFICGCILVALVSAAMRTKKSIDREKKPNTDGQPSAGNEINLRVHELPYYVKVLAALEIKMLEGIEDSVELQDNCLGNLGTVAVIGTLFGGANLASFMSGVEDGQSAGVGQFIGFVRFMAAGGGLITAVYAAVIMAMINTLPKDEFRPWAVKNVHLFPLPTLCLVLCIVMFSIDISITSFFLYGAGVTAYIVFCTSVCGCLTLVLASAGMRSKKPTNREKKEPASTDQPSGVNGDTSPRIPTQPFYIEIWAVLEMKILRGIKNPAELKQNFLGNLGTVAVIGTLFGGANLSSFMSGFNEGDHEGIGQLVGAVRITAAGWGLVSAVYSAIIMTMMNAVPKAHFDIWALANVYLFPLPTFCLLASMGMFSIDMMVTSYFLYGIGLTWYITGCFFACGCLILILAYFAMRKNNPMDYARRLSVNVELKPNGTKEQDPPGL